MAKSYFDIIQEIMRGFGSPRVVAEIDRYLAEHDRQREELLNLRAMAVRQHGELGKENAVLVQISPEEGRATSEALTSLTLNDLAARYRTDPDSSFHTLTHASRNHYEQLLKLILQDYGSERLSDLNARTFIQWHAAWGEGTNGSVAHAKIGQLRRLFSFGATMLEDPDCTRLSLVLNKLKFEVPKSRTEKMTFQQAQEICAKAHELGRPSVALAQAFQFDLKLRQKDVIGEWVPYGDRGESVLPAHNNEKWVRGLLWEEIDSDLVLSKRTTFGDIVFDLHKAPLVMVELKKRATPPWATGRQAWPDKGPVVVSEYSSLPWDAVEYRRWWRRIADAAGIPKEMRNADSRK